MYNRRIWIMFIVIGLLLAACNKPENKNAGAPSITKKDESEKEDNANLNEEEAKDIVVSNLEQMEEKIQEVPDEIPGEERLFLSEDILYPDKDTEETKEIIEISIDKFENLATDDAIDDMVREYLYGYYKDMEGAHMGPHKIQTRFEIVDQTEDSFEASFLKLEQVNQIPGSKYTIQYTKKNDRWLFDGYEYHDGPYTLTFDDLEEYYLDYKDDDKIKIDEFEEVETITSGGEEYLIARVDEYYVAWSINDMYENHELSSKYNETADTNNNSNHDTADNVKDNKTSDNDETNNADEDNNADYTSNVGELTKESLNSSWSPELETETLQKTLNPEDYTEYLGQWTDFENVDAPHFTLSITEGEGDQVDLRFSLTAAKGVWINDMWGEASFSSDGEATYDYDENYFGVSGTINVKLKKDGVEIIQDEGEPIFLKDRIVD